jgi:Ras GTPase-activating-like protein IQGAP2/3
MSYDNLMSPGAGSMSSKRLTNRNTNRYSVTALFSMAAEQDVDVEDELGRGASHRLTHRRASLRADIYTFSAEALA